MLASKRPPHLANELAVTMGIELPIHGAPISGLSWTRLRKGRLDQLFALRELLGAAQEKLAKRVEKDVDSISLIERGRSLPPLRILLALVDDLDVPSPDSVGMPAGEAGKTRQRFYLEAQIVAMIRQLSDRELELVRDQVALVMKHHLQKRRR